MSRGQAGRQGAAKPGPKPDARALRLFKTLERTMPSTNVELTHKTPLQLLVATILSAQCTDQRVNQVTPKVFERYKRAADYAAADQAELEALIKPTGFYKNKARHLIACGQALTQRFGGEVPDDMDALVTLPGVGRKTANVVLGACFGKPAIVVDTHVKRVANRLGLTSSRNPEKIEAALQQLLPPRLWTGWSQRLLLHGRYTCLARKPACSRCALYHDCRWEGKGPQCSKA